MILRSKELEIDLDGGEIRAESLFVSGYKINTHKTKNEGLFGVSVYGADAEQRRVKIEGYICEQIEENRHKLAQICTQSEPFYLIDGEYMLEVVAEKSPEYASEKRFSGKVLKYTLALESTSPLWLASERHSVYAPTCGNLSTDESAIYLTNESDTEIGFEAEITMRISGERVLIRRGYEYIDVRGVSLSAGDKLYISTLHGKKEVSVTRKSTAEVENLISFVDTGSTFFTLARGENRIDYNIESAVCSITLYYLPTRMR